MTNWPKPAEGSWTEHYPELGTGPISFRDSTSPEFYELEREAVFKRAWLNVARIEELPEVGSYLTKEIEAARASIVLVKGADEQVRAFYNLCRHRGNKLVWNDFPDADDPGGGQRVHLQALRVALRPRRCTDVRTAGFQVLRLRHGRLRSEPGALRHLERLHLHQLRPRAAPGSARVPRADDHRPRRLPLRQAHRTLRMGRAQQQQLEDLRRRVPGVLPRPVAARAAGAARGAGAQRRIRLRPFPTRRSAPRGVHRRYPPLAAARRVHVPH